MHSCTKTMLFSLAVLLAATNASPSAAVAPSRDDIVKTAVEHLTHMQEEDGAWPYQGVYRVRGEIPVGYRIGGTSIVCTALLYASHEEDAHVSKAIERGVSLILKELESPLMKATDAEHYDVRVWGHIYALDFFCRLRDMKREGEHGDAIEAWLPKLVAALKVEEAKGGGWNYATKRQHAPFVTSPAIQALLWAKSQNIDIEEKLLERAAKALQKSRGKDGAYSYSGRARKPLLPGAIARSPVSDATQVLLGNEDARKALPAAVDAFHEHWDELEKRRAKDGTHVAPYGVAPYYFYYGHRYVAQAIQLLPEEDQHREKDRLLKKLRLTLSKEGTWNDRVFPRSANFGTAMSVLALLGENVPLPPAVRLESVEK